MYFVLSPFFYYIANQDSIENYITIESGGKHISTLDYKYIKNLIVKYIEINSSGVDEHHKENYISFIYDKLVPN